jgi:hypothetical protein
MQVRGATSDIDECVGLITAPPDTKGSRRQWRRSEHILARGHVYRSCSGTLLAQMASWGVIRSTLRSASPNSTVSPSVFFYRVHEWLAALPRLPPAVAYLSWPYRRRHVCYRDKGRLTD